METDILALKEPARTRDFPAEKLQCLPVPAQPLPCRGGLGTAARGRPTSPLCARAGPCSPAWGWMACPSQPICGRGWSGRKPSSGMNGALFAASRAPQRPGQAQRRQYATGMEMSRGLSPRSAQECWPAGKEPSPGTRSRASETPLRRVL